VSTPYNIKDPSTSTRCAITGQFVSKNKLDATERARIAAAMVTGKLDLTEPCIHQAAALWRIPVCRVQQALRDGGNKNGRHRPKPTIINRLNALSPSEKAALGREYGLDNMWDHFICPALDVDRAAVK
jgi:hypothetical protein